MFCSQVCCNIRWSPPQWLSHHNAGLQVHDADDNTMETMTTTWATRAKRAVLHTILPHSLLCSCTPHRGRATCLIQSRTRGLVWCLFVLCDSMFQVRPGQSRPKSTAQQSHNHSLSLSLNKLQSCAFCALHLYPHNIRPLKQKEREFGWEGIRVEIGWGAKHGRCVRLVWFHITAVSSNAKSRTVFRFFFFFTMETDCDDKLGIRIIAIGL